MRVTFDNWEPAKERRSKQSCANLANPASNTFYGSVAENDERFGIAGV